ncbi:hypothetical protein N657DRAFT_567578 [Parathielavia appendiculata]|uniref:Uncharacterized protein n=1 Tax=Parathielavia appendiculata TaxID=2587402 RepID=A0AAN6Z5K5_9PEZI|nr:hypothetical protein N657DRAFT_567578 [Parathielavia appendiculata]
MSSIEEIVKLTGSESWKAWNARFTTEATNCGLWELINPTSASKGAYKTTPIKPDVANYEKRLDAPASNTRGNTPASGSSQVVAPGKPKNAAEMTAAGRDAYKIDLSEYREEKGDYEKELQNITFLCSWTTKTVAASLFDTTCNPEKKIHEWYAALKERVGTNDLQELRRAIEPPSIAKGAFVTFTERSSDEPDDHDPNPPHRLRRYSPPARFKKRRNSDSSTSACPACDNKHSLEECWAARPEIRPNHRFPSRTAEARAQERVKHDSELRKQVERLRKRVKREDLGSKAPAKSALKESDSQLRSREEH